MLLTLNDVSNFGDVSNFRLHFYKLKVSDFKQGFRLDKVFRIKTIFQTLDVVTDFGQSFRLRIMFQTLDVLDFRRKSHSTQQ